jgi:hypothetical protein
MEFHHQQPWHLGGPTDLANALPLCAAHHKLADHPQSYDMRHLANGRVRFTRRT